MDEDGRLLQMPVDELQSNPLQPRGVITPESLVDLVDSIREHGILEPLVVAKTPAGYQIIAGERRWRAARIAGLRTVPVIVKETSPKGMLEMAIVENLQRVDLNPMERARSFQRLIDEFHLTTIEVGKRVGKSQSFVSNSLRLLDLPDAIKDGILSGLITEGHARALASITDTKTMIEAYKIVLRESGSVRRTEEITRRMKSALGINQNHVTEKIVSEEIDRMRDEIAAVLTAMDNEQRNRTRVKVQRSRAETRIELCFKGTLEETEPKLQKVYKSLCGSQSQ